MDPYNHLRAYGEALIESVDPARAEVVAARALAAPSAGLTLRRRIVAVLAASATFISGNIGMAMAADQASPGDLLYGLDRAYEKIGELIGLGGDHTDERLDEASELASDGREQEALDIINDELDLADTFTTIPRDRATEAPDNETAAEASADAKSIVELVHQIAEAARDGDRAEVESLIAQLKSRVKDVADGKKNNGVGPPEVPGDRGKGGDRGNSGEAPPKP